jgi:hypothetical protein
MLDVVLWLHLPHNHLDCRFGIAEGLILIRLSLDLTIVKPLVNHLKVYHLMVNKVSYQLSKVIMHWHYPPIPTNREPALVVRVPNRRPNSLLIKPCIGHHYNQITPWLHHCPPSRQCSPGISHMLQAMAAVDKIKTLHL